MGTSPGRRLLSRDVLRLTKSFALRRLAPKLVGVGANSHVALTFDDGPDPTSTPAFLAALDELGWRATFFMLGAMVERFPEVAAEVAAAGHEVASHGYEHRSQRFRSPRAVRADIERSVEVIVSTTGRRPHWFRPPYGSLSAAALVTVRRAGMRTVLWTASGEDWRPDTTAHTVAASVADSLHGGDTVLLHDSNHMSRTPGTWRSTIAALPLLAELVTDRGLEVGPLAEHGLE
ncbi:MAG: polysaccharide deacetylase family protein [Egibacteraceae bacterium]